jgi:hypothetical protein
VLGMVVLVLPFCVVASIAHVDLWRYDRRTGSAKVIAGALMAILIGVMFLMRRWAWQFTAAQEPSSGQA